MVTLVVGTRGGEGLGIGYWGRYQVLEGIRYWGDSPGSNSADWPASWTCSSRECDSVDETCANDNTLNEYECSTL